MAAGSRSCQRILLVEDNRDVRVMLATLLRLHGYTVHDVANGATAIDAAQRFTADAVLIDLGLPDMTGYDVLKALQGMGLAEPPIFVAFSGRGDDDELIRAEAAGFAHFVVKPASFEQLQRIFDGPGQS